MKTRHKAFRHVAVLNDKYQFYNTAIGNIAMITSIDRESNDQFVLTKNFPWDSIKFLLLDFRGKNSLREEIQSDKTKGKEQQGFSNSKINLFRESTLFPWLILIIEGVVDLLLASNWHMFFEIFTLCAI